MPPAAGFGMSERLFAVLMDKPIREIVFFSADAARKQPVVPISFILVYTF